MLSRFPLLHRALVNFWQNLPLIARYFTTTISSVVSAVTAYYILWFDRFPSKPITPTRRSLIYLLASVSVCVYLPNSEICTHGITNDYRGQRQSLAIASHHCNALNNHIKRLLADAGIFLISGLSHKYCQFDALNVVSVDVPTIHRMLGNKSLETTLRLIETNYRRYAQNC